MFSSACTTTAVGGPSLRPSAAADRKFAIQISSRFSCDCRVPIPIPENYRFITANAMPSRAGVSRLAPRAVKHLNDH